MIRLLLSKLILITLAYAAHAEDLAMAGFLEGQSMGRPVTLGSLRSDYDIQINGDIVNVSVTQHFSNPTDQPMNLRYLFPLNSRAAVHSMVMRIGDETIEAVITPARKAVKIFNKAKKEGKAAALLEAHRPNMFTQKIGNLMPAQTMQIQIMYTHTINKVAGKYELVVPTVVGPRFHPPRRIDNTDPAITAHTDLPLYAPVHTIDLPDEVAADRLSLSISLESPLGIRSADSPTHKMETGVGSYEAQGRTTHHLQLVQGRTQDNRDFVLNYTLAGKSTSAGLLTHSEENSGYFSLLLEPPASASAVDPVPREMVFLLDCSGSMHGLPLEASKLFMRKALNGLRPADTFRIIRFSDAATEFSTAPLPATKANIQQGLAYLARLNGSGGTMMTSGIRQALSPSIAPGFIRNVIFLTDGYIGNEMEVFGLVEQKLSSARMFTYGTGTGTNRYLLDELARIGRGFSRYFDPTKDALSADAIAAELADYLNAPAFVDIDIDWGELNPVDVYPGRVPDLYAGQSVRVTGRVANPANSSPDNLARQIRIHGRTGTRTASLTVPFSFDGTPRPAIRQIWARSAIAERMHTMATPMPLRKPALTNADLISQITDLGMRNAIATRWTSFVAVSRRVYNPGGTANEADIALPRVAGVSKRAYAPPRFTGHGAPEPAAWISLFLISAGLWVFGRSRRRGPSF
jgi:Ca-activated chloride channel family protein